MKVSMTFVAALLIFLALLSSCTTLRLGTPVKASYSAWDQEAEKGADDQSAQEGWASRYVPGWKALSNLLPPPTDARKDWDKWMSPDRRHHRSGLPGE